MRHWPARFHRLVPILLAAGVWGVAVNGTQAACTTARSINSSGAYLVSNPDWGGAGGTRTCTFSYGCYADDAGGGMQDPPISNDLTGSFWAFPGYGLPGPGGIDNGTWDVTNWTKHRTLAGPNPYYYAAFLTLDTGPNYLPGGPASWGHDAGIDGCITDAFTPGVIDAEECTCVLLTDEWNNRGYFAVLSSYTDGGGDFDITPDTVDAEGDPTIRLSQIPWVGILDTVGGPLGRMDVTVDPEVLDPTSMQTDGACDCSIGYKIYSWRQIPDGSNPTSLTAFCATPGQTNCWDEALALDGGPQPWNPFGTPTDIRVNCDPWTQEALYLSTRLIGDPSSGGGILAGHVSDDAAGLTCGGNTPPTEAHCFDGADNDGDGATDCADSDCDGALGGACVTGQPGICSPGRQTCSGGAETCVADNAAQPEQPPADPACSDGLDNDCDGLTDGDDPDCFAACTGFETPFDVGWSMVGPVFALGYPAESMCLEIAADGGSPEEIDRFVNGGWESHNCGFTFDNFDVLAGEGYFVRSAAAGSWCQEGPAIPAPLNIDLDPGWSAVSIPPWTADRTAATVCAEITEQGGSPEEIDRFVDGGWESHNCGLPFGDFPVAAGEGYFVKSAGPATWTLEGPVRTSNVQPTSFTVSRTTDGDQDCSVVYGETPALGSIAEDDRGAGTVDDTHHVTLSGLTPDTPYYFDLDCDGVVDDNGGAHYSQATAPTIGIPGSDSIFGPVFHSDGTTWATGTIVYVQLDDRDGSGSTGRSSLLSDVVETADQGYWNVNLGNARVEDLSAYFSYSATGGDVTLQSAEGAAEGRASQEVDTASDAPAASLTLQDAGAKSPATATGRRAMSVVGEIEPASLLADLVETEVCPKRVVNRRDVALTVVWGNAGPVGGHVVYGTDPGHLDRTACDVRDDGGACDYVDRTHFVLVSGLTPSTTYYVQAVTGGAADGAPIEVRTGPTLSPPASDSVYGQAFLSDDVTYAEGAYTCATLQDADDEGTVAVAATECDLIDPGVNGYWNVNLGNARTKDLLSYFDYSPSADLVIQEVCGGVDTCALQAVHTFDDTPSPTVFLTDACCIPAAETCNGQDDDCDTLADEDDDWDGLTSCEGDCDDGDETIYPDAPEHNDGLDNQCPGNAGFGLVDELSGLSGFVVPGDKQNYCWIAQAGATEYEVIRSSLVDFSSDCMRTVTSATCWVDPAQPPSPTLFHYLSRPVTPHLGSWGQDSMHQERTPVCP